MDEKPIPTILYDCQPCDAEREYQFLRAYLNKDFKMCVKMVCPFCDTVIMLMEILEEN